MDRILRFVEGDVRKFVSESHHTCSQRLKLRLPPPADIAVRAKRLAVYAFGDSDAECSTHVAYWAGWLAYSVKHYGASFDTLCDLAAFPIAQVVAAITPDMRLSGPQRHLHYKSQLFQAPLLAQVVKFGELQSWAKYLLDHLTLWLPSERHQMVVEMRETLSAMQKLGESPWAGRMIQQLDAQLAVLGDRGK